MMQDLDDMGLLREFVDRQSEAAFAAIVARHVNKVYSVALRRTGNPHQAEEITQAVFVILARKAGTLGAKVVLSGWLYQTAMLTAVTHIRSEIRRSRREQEALMRQSLDQAPVSDPWPQIAPLLEDAMAKLKGADRTAVVLRYFDGKSLKEVGMALGSSEAAAKMRVNRAIEKLRGIFSKRGVTLSVGLIASALSANSVQAAPAGLTLAAATAPAQGAALSVALKTLVNDTMKMMTWLKLKWAASLALAALMVCGLATVALTADRAKTPEGSRPSPFQIRLVLDSSSNDSELLLLSGSEGAGARTPDQPLNVQKRVLLDQSAIQSVSVSANVLGGHEVNFTLTPMGRATFARVTRDNIGRRLAMVVGGRVVSAPIIRSEISGGQAMISGNFSEKEALDLAAQIRPRPER